MEAQEERAEREARQKREHEDRMAKLAATLGYADLARMVEHLIPSVRHALERGDEHLNTISLATWDTLAGVPPRAFSVRCKSCNSIARDKFCGNCGARVQIFKGKWPHDELLHTAHDMSLPWHRVRSHSLSDRVCVLKYVAKQEAKKEH